jgi:hypothetical protein
MKRSNTYLNFKRGRERDWASERRKRMGQPNYAQMRRGLSDSAGPSCQPVLKPETVRSEDGRRIKRESGGRQSSSSSSRSSEELTLPAARGWRWAAYRRPARSARRANGVVDDDESKEGRGSGCGGRELLLRQATAAAVSGEIPARWGVIGEGKRSRRFRRGRGARWCGILRQGRPPFIAGGRGRGV